MSARRISDPALPLLDALLEPELARVELERHLPELRGELELRSVTIGDVRYDPGVRAQILYRLKTRDPASGRSARPLVTLRLLAPGALPAPPERVELSASPAELRTHYVYDVERRIELLVYPLDPELPTLPAALDPKRVAEELGELWRPRGALARRVTVEPMGYTPQNRAAFGYEVLAEDRATRIPELRHLIGKLHAKKTADRLFAGSWALWRASEGRCRLAPPVGYLPRLGITLQERVPGERLGGLAGDPSFTRRVRQTARALAALHDVDIPLATRRKPDEEARVVHRWSAVLMAIRPDLARRIERLRDRLAATLEARVQLEGPVHADFHHTNVLVDAAGVTIIDLDEMAFGDPLLDVGRFLASLRIPSLRAFGSVHALREPREQFLQEYLRIRPQDEARVRLFEAACLFTAAASSFRIQRPAWPEEVELLVDEAADVFERLPEAYRASGGRREPGAFPVVAEPAAWARDPVYMSALLQAPLRELGVELRELRVRGRADDEILARYEVKGRRDGEKVSLALAGALLPGGGNAFLRRLERVREALPDVPYAPRLPRPISFVRALGMTVLELPIGEKLSALLVRAGGVARGEQVARALAVLHATPAELDRTRSLADDLHHLERRLARLREAQPELHPRAVELLAAVRDRSRDVPQRLGPALSSVRPQHVLLDGERVGFAHVETLTLATPLLDLGDFLARIALLELSHGNGSFAGARARFRAAYAEQAGGALEGAATLEAAALLRLACNQAGAADPRVAERLLARAAHALEASS